MAVPECRMSGRHCRGVLRDIQRARWPAGPPGDGRCLAVSSSGCWIALQLVKIADLQQPPLVSPSLIPRVKARAGAAAPVDIISSRRDVHDKTEGNLDSYAISTYKVVTQGSLWSLCSAGLSLQVCFQKSTQDVGAFVFLSVMLQLRRSRSLFSK